MKPWFLILHLGSVQLPPVTADGLLMYDSHFTTSRACAAAATVWRQFSYAAACRRAAR